MEFRRRQSIMSLFATLKSNAKLALRGSWGKAILLLLISLGASMLLSIVQGMVINIFVEPTHIDPAMAMRYGVDEFFFQQYLQTSLVELVILSVFSILSILLMAPLGLGVTHWYYALVHGRSAGVSEVFRFFESGRSYRRSLWYQINLSVRAFLWALALYLIPSGLMGACVAIVSIGEEAGRSLLAVASMGLLLSAALLLLASLFYGALLNKYALTGYLLCEDDNLSVKDAIRLSIQYSKGYRFSLLWFGLSFIGWFFLCVPTFFLLGLYVFPYVNTAMAMYARYIIEKGRWTAPNPTREFPAGAAAEPAAPEPSTFVEPTGSAEPTEAAEPPKTTGIDDFQFPASRIEPPPEEAPPVEDTPEE